LKIWISKLLWFEWFQICKICKIGHGCFGLNKTQ
jgi:hypothetical protein